LRGKTTPFVWSRERNKIQTAKLKCLREVRLKNKEIRKKDAINERNINRKKS
jgi:hypothetical protein